MLTPEGKVKLQLRKFYRQIGAYYFSPVQSGMGKRTVDDLICFKGRFIAVEAKAPGEKGTPRQDYIIEQILASGGQACYAHSVEEVIENIELFREYHLSRQG